MQVLNLLTCDRWTPCVESLVLGHRTRYGVGFTNPNTFQYIIIIIREMYGFLILKNDLYGYYLNSFG